MSRIGKQPVSVPGGVKAFLRGQTLKVEGPVGKVEQEFHSDMVIEIADSEGRILVKRPSDGKKHKALHGLTRTLINNMVEGVTKGFEKKLEINGVGYNAKLQGRELVLAIGFCHPVMMKIPQGVELEIPQATSIVIKGCDKQQVGQFAANIRRVRPPEPYKGKGIRYSDEVIRRKAGKKFGSGE